MAEKTSIEALFRKHLGKEAGDALLAKVDKMASQKAPPAKIEKVVMEDISAEIEKAVVSTVIAKIGPITPVKVKPISSEVRVAIRPIIISPKVTTGVQTKVGPGTYTKGSR